MACSLFGCDEIERAIRGRPSYDRGYDRGSVTGHVNDPIPQETAEQALQRLHREECAQMASTPNSLLETSGQRFFDRGIINSYRQIQTMTVLNRARYCVVRSAEGDFTWVDANGARLGSVPFTLSQSIPAGGTVNFSTQAGNMVTGTMAGAGVRVTTSFTRVDVIPPT